MKKIYCYGSINLCDQFFVIKLNKTETKVFIYFIKEDIA